MAFFDQKHGLTPLVRQIFWTLKNSVSYGQNRFFFSAKSLSVISSHILTKSK